MMQIGLITLIILGICGMFLANVFTYKSDKEVIEDYFKNCGDEILQIKNSSESKFKNKSKLKKIRDENWVKNLLVINKSGPLLKYSFYTIATVSKKEIGLFVTNSFMFFIKPKLHFDN